MRRKRVDPDSFHRFRNLLLELANVYEIRNDKNCDMAIECLLEELERAEFERTHKMPTKKKEQMQAEQYIAMFRHKYYLLFDLEYTKKVDGPIEIKIIKNVVKMLEDNHCSIEDYLNWAFDVFLPENRKFCPPAIRTTCSDFMVHKFLVEQKEVIAKRHEDDKEKMEEKQILAHGRMLVRTLPNKEEIRNLIHSYSYGELSLEGFKEKLLEAETKGKEQ